MPGSDRIKLLMITIYQNQRQMPALAARGQICGWFRGHQQHAINTALLQCPLRGVKLSFSSLYTNGLPNQNRAKQINYKLKDKDVDLPGSDHRQWMPHSIGDQREEFFDKVSRNKARCERKPTAGMEFLWHPLLG